MGHLVSLQPPEQLQCDLAAVVQVAQLHWKDATTFFYKYFSPLVFCCRCWKKSFQQVPLQDEDEEINSTCRI